MPAKKTDATPMATVFSRDDYMYLHEEGGTKRPEEGKALAVPVNIVQRGRIVGRHLRPSTILEKPGYFVAPIKSGSKTGGLFRRVGAKSRTTWTKNRRSGAKVSTTKALRQHIELLYVFTPQAKVAPRFGFEQLVMSAVNRYFPSEFDGALDYALRTSRVLGTELRRAESAGVDTICQAMQSGLTTTFPD